MPSLCPRPRGVRTRAGQVAFAALLWALGLALFTLPFLHPERTNWKAADPGRKTAYYDEDDETLDLPFLEDLAGLEQYLQEAEVGLEGDLDEVISAASRRRYGRDYRGYFAPDREAYERDFVADPDARTHARPEPAPIDLTAAAATGLFQVERLAAGERTYYQQCAGCHGLAGDGGGPGAGFLAPRPRNFRHGVFKFTTTSWDSRPRRADLFRTLTHGLVGSAMPRFNLMPEEKRWDVIEYVRYLAVQGEFEQTMLELTEVDEEIPDPDEVAELVEGRWRELREEYPASPEPPADEASIERGRELFTSQTCHSCHGETGRGDGPTADEYTDMWGYPIRPRDLTGGALRVGLEGKDLWVLIAHGIKGTPMPGAISALSSDEVWHLVHFVQYLASGAAAEGE